MKCVDLLRAVKKAAFSALFLCAFSETIIADQWLVKPDMPTGRQEIYAGAAEGRIYIPGGILADGVTTSAAFEAFDVKENKWVDLASLPTPRHHITPAVIGGQIYAVGGFDGPFPEWEMKSDMFIYDIKKDKWRKGVPLPKPRGEHVAVALDNRVHVIGGRITKAGGKSHFDSFLDTGEHDIFDPSTNQWTKGAAAITARNSAAAAVIDGLIYVVGGRKNVIQEDGGQLQQNLGTLEVYDPKKNIWETLAPMPEALGGNAAAALGGKLYVFGGEQWAPEHKVFSSVWVYDPRANTWSKETGLLTARHGLAGAAVDEVVYSIGGCTVVGGGAAVGATEALSLVNADARK